MTPPAGSSSPPGHGRRSRPSRLRLATAAGSEFFRRRHLELIVAVTDGRDEQALFGLPRDDRRARGLRPSAPPGPGIEPEVSLLLVRSVALQTILDEDRPDLRLEELHLLGSRLSFLRMRGDGRPVRAAWKCQANRRSGRKAGRGMASPGLRGSERGDRRPPRGGVGQAAQEHRGLGSGALERLDHGWQGGACRDARASRWSVAVGHKTHLSEFMSD